MTGDWFHPIRSEAYLLAEKAPFAFPSEYRIVMREKKLFHPRANPGFVVPTHEHLSTTVQQVVGNDYLVMGTVERSTWRKGMKQEISIEEMRQHAADFQAVLTVEYEPVGWYPSR